MRILTVDARRRISLGDLATSEYYRAEVNDGVITLTPVVIMRVVKRNKGGYIPHAPDVID